jgi:hypothetical protein
MFTGGAQGARSTSCAHIDPFCHRNRDRIGRSHRRRNSERLAVAAFNLQPIERDALPCDRRVEPARSASVREFELAPAMSPLDDKLKWTCPNKVESDLGFM